MNKQVAIIKNVRVGAEDHYGAALWFDMYISEGSCALWIIPIAEAADIIGRFDDIKHLEGKPCWVEVDNGIIRFLKLWDR